MNRYITSGLGSEFPLWLRLIVLVPLGLIALALLGSFVWVLWQESPTQTIALIVAIVSAGVIGYSSVR